MNQNSVLLIFVKNPEKGKVKTRLAETLGDEQALQVYNQLLSYTRDITALLDIDKQVWYTWYIPEQEDSWNHGNFEKKLQRGDDLGRRMHYAFREAFSSGYEKVVIIGSDCAQLTSEILQEAYHQLEESDVVIGPSHDGGYYLLGMNAFYGDLFKDIDWSTPEVFEQTKSIISELKLSLSTLPELNDVDTEEDWKEVKGKF